MFDRFTDEAINAIEIAQERARHDEVARCDDVHLLIGCCRAKGSLAAEVLLGCGQDPSEVAMRAEARADSLTEKTGSTPPLPFSERAQEALTLALEEAAELHHSAIGTHHILLGLLRLTSPLGEVLRKSGLTRAEARRVAAGLERADQPTRTESRSIEAQKVLRAAAEICMGQDQTELAVQLLQLAARMKPRS